MARQSEGASASHGDYRDDSFQSVRARVLWAASQRWGVEMEEVAVRGAEYVRLALEVWEGRGGSRRLRGLATWHQPIRFHRNSHQLRQRDPGPCGLLAVLQAHMLAQDSPDWEMRLYNAVLDILARLSRRYIMCTGFNDERREAFFQATGDRDTALAWLMSVDYLGWENAAILLAISYIFAAARHAREPWIASDSFAYFSFVYLLLDGGGSNEHLYALRDRGWVGSLQSHIGFEVRDRPRFRTGSWLNPRARVAVLAKGAHFLAIVHLEGRVEEHWDSFNPAAPRRYAP